MRIVGTLVALGVWMTPVMVTVGEQPSWAQSQQPSAEEIAAVIQHFMEQAIQLQRQGKPAEALEVLQEVLAISQQLELKEIEGLAWLGIGRNSHDMGKLQAALKAYQQALLIRREVQDRGGEATVLNNLGAVYDSIGEPQRALEAYQQALLIRREVQDRGGEATTLNNLGVVYYSIGEPQQAIDYYQQALPIFQAVQNKAEEATTLSNLGLVYGSIGEPQRAIEYYQQALPIFREVQDQRGEAATLNNLGLVYDNIGEPQRAIEYYQQALSIRQEVQDRRGEAMTLSNLGAVYLSIGKLQQAIEYYQQALPIYQEVGDRRGEAITLNNWGAVYRNIGELQQAIEYYQRALPIFREVQNRGGEAATLNNLGAVYDSIGEPQQAIEYYQQALPIVREVQNRGEEATTLNNLGLVYDSIGEPQQAIEYYQQALPIYQAVQDRGGKATALSNLGSVYNSIGQPQQAIEYYQQALPIFRAVENREGEAITLSNLGAVYRDTNQPEKAIEHLQQSLEITISLRSNLKQEHRKTFIEPNKASAIALTSLLIEQNQPKEAFTWINRVTTYELADYTRLLGAKVQNPEAQALIDQYNQRSQYIESLRRQLQLDISDDQLSRRISDLETENIKLGEDIAQQYPEAADLFETRLIDIDQLQATIPKGTLVLQPVPLTNVTNTPDTLALFLLTRDSFEVVQTSLDAEKFNQLVQRYPQELETSDENLLKTSRKLYDILIRPIEDQLNAYNPQHLSIIATGQLRYIPFESLNNRETKQYLIEQYPISYLTRLSQPPSNAPTPGHSSRLLAFGNPKPNSPLDLPGTEAEVNTITRLFRNSRAYLHQNATLSQFKTQAPKFPFLHLATHGCFQSKPCIFETEENGKTETETLSANTILFADRQWPIQDAALLGLNQTQLIALSACQTAREADLEGNSVSGVAYLFERAGAQAVMASLWQAEDRYTQELMSDFYQYVAEGMTQAEALRQAKLNQIQLNHSAHVWSHFIIIGNAHQAQETGFLPPVARNPVAGLIAGSILLMGGFWWLKRR